MDRNRNNHIIIEKLWEISLDFLCRLAVTGVYLGANASGGNPLNGWLHRFIYWDYALTNAGVQTVTT
jgi:hypothetical protein